MDPLPVCLPLLSLLLELLGNRAELRSLPLYSTGDPNSSPHVCTARPLSYWAVLALECWTHTRLVGFKTELCRPWGMRPQKQHGVDCCTGWYIPCGLLAFNDKVSRAFASSQNKLREQQLGSRYFPMFVIISSLHGSNHQDIRCRMYKKISFFPPQVSSVKCGFWHKYLTRKVI